MYREPSMRTSRMPAVLWHVCACFSEASWRGLQGLQEGHPIAQLQCSLCECACAPQFRSGVSMLLRVCLRPSIDETQPYRLADVHVLPETVMTDVGWGIVIVLSLCSAHCSKATLALLEFVMEGRSPGQLNFKMYVNLEPARSCP